MLCPQHVHKAHFSQSTSKGHFDSAITKWTCTEVYNIFCAAQLAGFVCFETALNKTVNKATEKGNVQSWPGEMKRCRCVILRAVDVEVWKRYT